MSTSDSNTPPPDGDDERRRRSPEFDRALSDLEQAVIRLAGTAQRQIGDRAVEAIEEAARRLRRDERRHGRPSAATANEPATEREPNAAADAAGEPRQFQSSAPPPPPPSPSESGRWEPASHRVETPHRRGRYRDETGDRAQRWERRAARAERRSLRRERRRERLVRVPAEGVIGGVCAGLARRFGVETWVVRIMAVTGLVFTAHIVFIGYWVLFFMMRQVTPSDADALFGSSAAGLPREPIPGFDRAANPRSRLRSIRAAFDVTEQRLRRVESYVTSSRFELERALQDLEKPN